MRGGAALAVFLLASAAPGRERVEQMLARVAEEAEVFRQVAPQVLAEETLRQRVRVSPERFRPRLGAGALQAPKVEHRSREIISEYGYATFEESSNVLHEIREVISVDGREVTDPQKARRTLTSGATSRDDKLKKRMLESLEQHGLEGAATDFGQVILLFVKRRLEEFQFHFAGQGRIGADEVLGLTFRQTDGERGVTIFERGRVTRRPLQGEIWVRESDFLPIRVRLFAVRERDDFVIRDEATVDYAMSPHGVVLPAAVLHRQFAAEQLVVENAFQYSPFRRFTAEAEIKFGEIPPRTPERP